MHPARSIDHGIPSRVAGLATPTDTLRQGRRDRRILGRRRTGSCLGDRTAPPVSSSNEWWYSPTAASRLASTGEALPTARNWPWPIRATASREPARRRGMLRDAVLALLMGLPGEDQKQREEADHVADGNGPALAQPLTDRLGLRELVQHLDARRGAETQHQTAEADRLVPVAPCHR